MKKRLDQLLVERKLVKSREEGQRLILAGEILVFGQPVGKVGFLIDENAEIKIKEKFPYVSRGALKLEAAAKEFRIDFKDKIVCDVGASTGGFTDFVLQGGAKKVYAIDVGYGQLDQKLRQHSRVVVMERTNIKELNSWEKFKKAVILATERRPESKGLKKEDSGHARVTKEENIIIEPVDIFLIDVSFISLKQILPVVLKIIHSCHSRPIHVIPAKAGIQEDHPHKEIDPRIKSEDDRYGVEIIVLIKPQFEVGKKEADRYKGVIKDPKLHREVVDDIKNWCQENGFKVLELIESPILGAKGNKEFLLRLKI